jgi:hypothetical protein
MFERLARVVSVSYVLADRVWSAIHPNLHAGNGFVTRMHRARILSQLTHALSAASGEIAAASLLHSSGH